MLNGPESTLFCRGTGSIRGRPIFFFCSVPLLLTKIKISILQKNAHRAGNWEQMICTGYCDVDRLSAKANTIRTEKRCVALQFCCLIS